MKIEHHVPRAADPARMFEWLNLLGVCGGIYGTERTCDTYREDRPLALNPKTATNVTNRFRYTPRGQILAGDDDPEGKAAIEALNLDAVVLRRNRAAVVAVLQRELRRDDSIANIKRLLRKAIAPLGQQSLPFAGVAIHYLDRKLRRHGVAP